MTTRPLSLAFIWHMHQPFYKDLVSNEYILPWVRLHAVKDYYTMVSFLDKFPEVKFTFNLVPSLLIQIEDYIQNQKTIKDKYLELTLKNPQDLTEEEKIFILQKFFMANWETMIKPYSRYHDLLLKRGRFISSGELLSIAKRFSSQEFLDLQTWFNLTWFGFREKSEDPIISEFLKKGKYFSAEDKHLLIQKQFEVMGKIIPKYREVMERGQIELSTTPFYHPILPLLCDSNLAREALPHLSLPQISFQHPEDAETQIRRAVEFHARLFGRHPEGMWPSEGSVSESIIPLAGRAGIKWMATDEGILERSLHKIELRARTLSAEELYQPYLIEKDGVSLSLLFRNHFISDQIGFVYYRWKVKDALADFNSHLQNIALSLPEDGKNYLIAVILDGENAWEYYPEGGREFLEAFYSELSQNALVRTVKVEEYLKENPPSRKLSRLFAGSWIDSNFKIWIGHEEDNLAWQYLDQARKTLAESGQKDNIQAWQEIYIAEGSDWNWWYGDDHSSDSDAAFDALFRKHLQNVYFLINQSPPRYLEKPIKKIKVIKPLREPIYLIQPTLDGEVTNYYEWLSAGFYDLNRLRGTMHQSETILKEVYYGFSLTSFYLQLKLNLDLSGEEAHLFSFSLITFVPQDFKGEIVFKPEENRYIFNLFRLNPSQEWDLLKTLDSFGIKKIIELGIPFSDLEAKPGGNLEFAVVISKENKEIERWPRNGTIGVTLPTEDYELRQWYV